MLDSIPRSGHLVGLKQVSRALRDGHAKAVFLASDCDETIKKQVRSLCKEVNVECYEMYTMEALGKSCGIDVGASVVAIM